MQKIFGVIGDPIEHSLSPDIHNAWYKEYGIDAVYLKFHVLPRQIAQSAAGIRGLGISGVNVTVPHKTEIMQYLDDISIEAREVGAVNTVVNADGRLIGRNTDIYGFENACVLGLGIDLSEMKNVVLFGAGGAARAVLYVLKNNAPAAAITIIEQDVIKAKDLAKSMGMSVSVISSSDFSDELLAETQLLINATPVGLNGKGQLFDYTVFKRINDCRVFDLAYVKGGTPLTKAAAGFGLSAIDGMLMLKHQAAKSFEYWFGFLPTVK